MLVIQCFNIRPKVCMCKVCVCARACVHVSLLSDRTGLAGEGRDNLYRGAYLMQVETYVVWRERYVQSK